MKQQIYEEALKAIKEEAFEGLRSDQRITALLNIYERVSKLLPKGNDFDDERAVIRGLLNGR